MKTHDRQREKGKPVAGRGKSENPWQAEGKGETHDRQREKVKPVAGRGKSENP